MVPLWVARHVLAKIRAKLKTPVSNLKTSGKVGKGGAELGFKDSQRKAAARLRTAPDAFDAGKSQGLLVIDEAQVLAGRRHGSLEKALWVQLHTRKDRLKVILTGSSAFDPKVVTELGSGGELES